MFKMENRVYIFICLSGFEGDRDVKAKEKTNY